MAEKSLSLAIKAFFEEKRSEEALRLLKKCRLDKLNRGDRLQYHTLAALAAFKLGRVREAVEAYKMAAEYCDDGAMKRKLFSNYLMYSHYLPEVSNELLRAEHFRYEEFFRDIVPFSHTGHQRKKEKLRVGYLSPTFSTHIVINFAIQLFAQYDRQFFEVVGYDLAATENRTTAQVKALMNGWRNLSGLDALAAARRIYDDEVDILVDLGGHTAGGEPLGIMAYRPAPVQLSMIGYFDTTGISAMDYFLGDVCCDPDEVLPLFREEVLRLSHSHLCYTPSEAAAKANIEYKGRKRVTFGSFNNYAKITDEMLLVWKSILDSVPGARLILKNVSNDEEAVTEMRRRTERLGLCGNRVELRRGSFDYIEEYAELDIALDTYPYPGGGTTCEALYMGVPVITLYGNRHGSRFGYSLLESCGIGELAVRTKEEYRERAIALASDKELLMALHRNLRPMLQKSPLMDGRAYTREVEAAYREAWKKWREKVR